MVDKAILILNGPGLSELGSQDDKLTLAHIEQQCIALGKDIGLDVDFRQYDDATELARCINRELASYAGLIINPVSYSHAANVPPAPIEQALEITADLNKPVIEVHLRNTFLPDSSIEHPLQAPDSNIAFIAGLGAQSYLLAMKAIQQRINKSSDNSDSSESDEGAKS